MDADILETTREYNKLLEKQLKELEKRNNELIFEQNLKLLEIYKHKNQLLLNEINLSIVKCEQYSMNNQSMLEKIHENINRKNEKK
jgi:hypothetical protein